MSGLNYSWYDRRTIAKGTQKGTEELVTELRIANRLQAEGNILLRILAMRLAPEYQLPMQIDPTTGAVVPPTQ